MRYYEYKIPEQDIDKLDSFFGKDQYKLVGVDDTGDSVDYWVEFEKTVGLFIVNVTDVYRGTKKDWISDWYMGLNQNRRQTVVLLSVLE